MNPWRFDALARSITPLRTCRFLGRVAGLGAVSSVAFLAVDSTSAGAGKRQVAGEHNVRGKKVIMSVDGETVHVPRKKRKKFVARGAKRGKCHAEPVCTPVCTGCGGPDGCGGTCPGCAAGTICVNDTCQACTLTCDDTPGACGDALKAGLAEGGTMYLCPGTYEGTFTPTADAEIYGAGGDTDDPLSSTILVAPTNSRVMSITTGISLLLSGVRVTGGRTSGAGGGIYLDHADAEFSLRNSVISGNEASYIFVSGGGIANYHATVTISHSEISGNSTLGNGGGISNQSGNLTITNSTIARNSAGENGGGIYQDASGVTTLDATVTVTGNEANVIGGGTSGGGVYRAGGTVNINGAAVTGNEPDQYAGGISGCS